MTSGAIDEGAQRFGPYVLLHVAGAGGMGRVQLALSGRAGMSKLCVLKRIHAELGNPEQEARFRREATLALRLSHGAIAQTFSVDEIEGELCISQEFVEGVSLARLLRSCRSLPERVPTAVVLYVAREVARALAYAHALEGGGVVHRDVVPDNVMLSYGGEVKLIDFGIAKIAGDASLTQTGMIVGRLSHTAPEVLAGRPADARVDLYSLGVVLWELLTGASPDEVREHGAGAEAMFPAPSTRTADVPPAVDALVVKLLAADPDARYQRADEVQQALGELLAPGFVGERALADLLGRHYEIERERDYLAIEVARAERGLEARLVGGTPAGGAPVRGAPVSGAPVSPAPVRGAPVKAVPVRGAPVKGTPVRGAPVSAAPAVAAPTGVSDAWFNEGARADVPESAPVGSGTAPIRDRSNAKKVALVAAAATTVIAGAIFLRGADRPPAPAASPVMPALPRPRAPVSAAPPAAVLPPPAVAPPAVAPPPAVHVSAAPSAPAASAPVAPGIGARPNVLPALPKLPERAPAAPPPAPAVPVPVAARAPVAPPSTPPDVAPAIAPPPGDRVPSAKGTALTARAEESFERGELPQAISLARSAARSGGGYRAYLIAGRALLADGRTAEAETELVQAAALAPSGNPDAATLLERVRARRQRMGE